jgi:hypothetical protein
MVARCSSLDVRRCASPLVAPTPRRATPWMRPVLEPSYAHGYKVWSRPESVVGGRDGTARTTGLLIQPQQHRRFPADSLNLGSQREDGEAYFTAESSYEQ